MGLNLNFKYRIIASGTPMPNSCLELWGQISFIRPELLPSSFYAFRNIYAHLERNGQAMQLAGQRISADMMRHFFIKGWKYVVGAAKRKLLMDKINPVTHWVKKEDALD